MGNIGLRNDSKQLKISLSGIDCYLNLSKQDMNLILDIPLYEIEFPFSYKFGLVYNYLKRNVEYSFGYGVDFSIPRLSYDSVNNTCIVTNPDKTEDIYTYDSNNKYVSTNTTSYIIKNNSIYTMYDIAGNSLKYDLSQNGMYNQHIFDGLPIEIKTYSGKSITTSKVLDAITFSLGLNDQYGHSTIQIGAANQYLNAISIYCNSLDIDVHNSITYTDGLQKRIKILYYNYMNAVGRHVYFKFEDEKVTLIDGKTFEAYEFDFTETDQALVKHYFYYNIDPYSSNTPNEITTVNYLSNSKTEVIDNYNHKEYYLFNPSTTVAVPLYQIDHNKNYIDNKYNENKHLLTYQATLNTEGNTNYTSINEFTSDGLTVSSYIETDELYSYLTRSPYRVVGTGYLTFEKKINALQGDNYELFFLVKVNSINHMFLNVTFDNSAATLNPIQLRKYDYDGEYELVSAGIHLDKSSEKIYLSFHLELADLIIGSIRIIKRNTFVYYTYNNSTRLLTKIKDKYGKTEYTYGTNGRITRIDYPNGEYELIDYDTNHIDKVIKTTNSFVYNENKKIYKDITYNTNYENVTSEKFSNYTDSKYIKTSRTYNNKLEVYTEEDELGNTNTYTYNNNRQITAISYPITSNNKKFEYDSSHRVTKISIENTSSGTGDDVTSKYVYDSTNGMISTVTSNNGNNNTDGSVSSYEYNGSNELDKFKINNTVLNKFGYNQKGQVTTIKHGNNDNLYYSLTYDSYGELIDLRYIVNNYIENQYTFEYSRGKITTVFWTSHGSTILKSYYYDSNDRLKKLTSNYSSYTYDYYYDDVDNLKMHRISTYGIKRVESFSSNDENIVSTTYTTNQYVMDNANLVPFNGTLISSKGLNPIHFDTTYYENELYYFDDTYKRFSIKTENTKLAYDFSINNMCTMMLRFKITAASGTQYILSNTDGSNNINIYSNNGAMQLDVNGIGYSLNYIITPGNWYFLSLRFTKITSNLTVYVNINDTLITQQITLSNTFGYFKTYVGCKYDLNYNLKGYVMDMMALTSLVSNNDLATLRSRLNETKSMIYHLDNLNRLNTTYVKYNTSTVLSKSFVYNCRTNNTNFTSNQVNREIFSINGNSYARCYTYDSMNRITGISDSLFGSRTYTYDSRGFLASETANGQTLNYTYDNNGNIISISRNYYPYASDTFSYNDSNSKDKLTSYNNMNISYSSSCLGMITHFDDYSYSYEGKRMISAYYSDAGDYKQISYEYDEEGLMTKRNVYRWQDDDDDGEEEDTLYMYENGNLVTEIKGDTRNDYLYDNSGNLYGFIVNNTDTYYYVRDILGTILGVVDNTGTLIIKYDYDAYGNASRTNVVSNYIYNPFIYKGYYYDKEVEMYYLKTRFYNPTLRRFMIPDNINYLDINNVGCINLYAYCNNNPVMYVDPDGNGIIISLVVSLSVAIGLTVYEDYKDDKSVNGSIGAKKYIGAFFGGLISGFGIGIISTTLLSMAGTFVDEVISNFGEFNMEDALSKTLTAGFLSLTGYAINEIVQYGVSLLETNALKYLANKIGNNTINRYLRKVGENLYIGSNKMINIANALYKYDKNYIAKIVGALSSNVPLVIKSVL